MLSRSLSTETKHDPSHKKRDVGDNDGGDFLSKRSRVEESFSNIDLSTFQKKKSPVATRTGQACDRCKIRKIRCDARPEGCSPCMQNNTICRTTDRITGRATSRGHTETLEQDNAALASYLLELQQQLRDHGLEPKQSPEDILSYLSSEPGSRATSFSDAAQSHDNQPRGNARSPDTQISHQHIALPHFRAGCVGDNYFGVSTDNNALGSIEGTSLALFGTKIDLVEFTVGEGDPTTAPMSYHSFLRYAFAGTRQSHCDLPSFEKCKLYADWYFRSFQPFVPVLCRRDFSSLLNRIFLEAYQPSPAEVVMVHMLMASMDFQIHARNADEKCLQDSVQHYHYAIGFVPELIASHTLEDMQALTMICGHLRCQPRPGAAWWFTHTVMSLAIESGLHRSASAWKGSSFNQDPHHLEMRKRVFWTLLFYTVQISGKLGRPMPLRIEDFDIEVPKAIDDDLPSDLDLSPFRKCTYRAGIETAKLMPIVLGIYSTIYTINSTGQYERNAKRLGDELDTFYASIPNELKVGEHTKDEARVAALYLDLLVGEHQLLLHHPAVCRTRSPEVIARSLDKCLTWSTKILAAAVQLKSFKSLDTTLYGTTTFLAAIFITLFIMQQRRKEITKKSFRQLQVDIELWLDVFGEVGHLLGTGTRLRTAVKDVCDRSLANIGQDLELQPTTKVQETLDRSSNINASHTAQNITLGNEFAPANAAFVPPTNLRKDPMPHYAESVSKPHSIDQTQYLPEAAFTYPQPYGNQAAVFPDSNLSNFIPSSGSYQTTATSITMNSPQNQPHHRHSHLQQHPLPPPIDFTPPFTPMPSNFPLGLAFQPQIHNLSPEQQPVHSLFHHPTSAAWRHFADTLMHNVGGQGHNFVPESPALNLLDAGAGPAAGSELDLGMNHIAHVSGMQVPLQNDASQPWPQIHYASGGGGPAVM